MMTVRVALAAGAALLAGRVVAIAVDGAGAILARAGPAEHVCHYAGYVLCN